MYSETFFTFYLSNFILALVSILDHIINHIIVLFFSRMLQDDYDSQSEASFDGNHDNQWNPGMGNQGQGWNNSRGGMPGFNPQGMYMNQGMNMNPQGMNMMNQQGMNMMNPQMNMQGMNQQSMNPLFDQIRGNIGQQNQPVRVIDIFLL